MSSNNKNSGDFKSWDKPWQERNYCNCQGNKSQNPQRHKSSRAKPASWKALFTRPVSENHVDMFVATMKEISYYAKLHCKYPCNICNTIKWKK